MSLANRFILAGIAYGIIGMLMGLVMGASGKFDMAPVHAHIILLGWVSMALFGLIYRNIPSMAGEKLAVWQFWISNLGLIIMMITLAMVINKNMAMAPVLAVSEIVVVFGMLIFAWLMWKYRTA